jgi:hypothetical protein
MSKQELKLLNVLYDVNVPPSKISSIFDTVRDDDRGTFLPKTSFNINEKFRNLIDLANEILPTCSDTEKTLRYLQLFNMIHVLFYFLILSKDIDYYCVIHVSGQGLFSESKGRPKGGSRIKLPCFDSMEDKMLELRRDF